jgi:GNAT superfamily N-acetyltransferase
METGPGSSAPRLRVRDATVEDAVTIAALSSEVSGVLRTVGNAVASLDEATLRRDGFGSAPAFGVLLAERGGEPAGYLLHAPGFDPDLGGRVLTVVDLFVRERFRGEGIGRSLVGAAAERARARGLRALAWWVREANPRAIAFYERLGARTVPGVRSMHLPLGDP